MNVPVINRGASPKRAPPAASPPPSLRSPPGSPPPVPVSRLPPPTLVSRPPPPSPPPPTLTASPPVPPPSPSSVAASPSPPSPSPPPLSPAARSPPPPSPADPTSCPSNVPCCLNGVTYDSCQTDSDNLFSYTQYYKAVSGGVLQVAIRASTNGWIAWNYNANGRASMNDGDAFFARICPTCPTGVSSVAFNLGNIKSPSGFTTPTKSVTYTPVASGSSAGEIWASFTVTWPGGSSILIRYGGGPYSGGSPTSPDGMGYHPRRPQQMCITDAGEIRAPAACASG